MRDTGKCNITHAPSTGLSGVLLYEICDQLILKPASQSSQATVLKFCVIHKLVFAIMTRYREFIIPFIRLIVLFCVGQHAHPASSLAFELITHKLNGRKCSVNIFGWCASFRKDTFDLNNMT